MAAISEGIKLFLLKSFDVRNGEMQRALLMQFNIFLIISTLLIVKPTVNGLFLAKFGVEQLPWAFILVAVVAAIVSTLYSRVLTKVSLHKISIGVLISSVLSLIFFGLFLHLNIFENVILYIFYIWVAIFALLATSQFWVLGNLVFNPREAKRLFGFIGAGAIAGGILGGYLTSILAQFMSSESLPFIGAALLAICVPVTQRVWNKYVDDVHTPFQQKKNIHGDKDYQHPFRLILKSKHLTYIASIVAVSVMVAKLVDYQFGGIAAALIPDPDELTAFFGFWFGTFNVISLLTQLFLTHRVVGTFGVGSSLFFLPITILLAVIFLLLMPELLMAAVFLKMADGGLKQSINKAAMELLIMPIPTDIKSQTKTFIDVFVDSLATGIIGLVLIFLIKGLDLSTNAISFMIVGLLFFWMFLATKVRKEYLRSFKLKIEATTNHHKKEIDISNESVIGGLKKVLDHGNEDQILYVLEKIREKPLERLFESIRKLLYHDFPEVRAAALNDIYFYKKHNIADQVKNLTHDLDQEVRIAAFKYLIKHEPGDEVELLQQYISETDYQVSGAAIVSLAKETRTNSKLKRHFDLENIIQSVVDEIPTIENEEHKNYRKITALKAIGYANLPKFFPIIEFYFSDKNLDVKRQAIISAGNTLSTKFIFPLVEFSLEKDVRGTARNALVQYGKGIVYILKNMAEQPETSIQTLRLIPSIVKKIGTQRSVNFLFQLFEYDDLIVRKEALRGLNTLRNNFPHLKFNKKSVVNQILNEAQLYQNTLSVLHAQSKRNHQSINNKQIERITKTSSPQIIDARKSLVTILEKGLDRNLERIFRLLGLKYSGDDILTIYKGLNHEKPDLRINALEFLDNLLQPGLKKVLIPLMETSMLETISEEAVKKLKLDIPTEYECFEMLLSGRDVKIKLAILFLITQLKDPKYLSLVQKYTDSKNSKVKRLAKEAESVMRISNIEQGTRN